MKILYLTKSKPYTCEALLWMVQNHSVTAVICKTREVLNGTEMDDICRSHGIPVYANDEVYKKIRDGSMPHADIAISNTFGHLIKPEFIHFMDENIWNLHGAILPFYKGLFAYNHGILNGETQWGVTAHFVNEQFDEGDIIKIKDTSKNLHINASNMVHCIYENTPKKPL